jgi:phosphoenolpyruvate carboxykinase (ATP)
VIAVSLTDRMILIGGTAYAGEMKKSVFGVLNYMPAGDRRDADALLGQYRP